MGSYEQIAVWYDAWLRAGSAIHTFITAELLAMIGNVQGQVLCDMACGQGIVARQLAQCGAQVVGIDLADSLLTIARQEEQQTPLGIAYRHDDAQTLSTLADASYDGVVCNLALMDISDINATFRNVQRILRPSGAFAFSLTHPCFEAPQSRWLQHDDGTTSREVRDYFAEGFWRSDNINGVRGQVGAYHRTLSTYVNALLHAGLHIERISEPRAIEAVRKLIPGYGEVPAALLVMCRSGQ